jgi:hypothetical protein
MKYAKHFFYLFILISTLACQQPNNEHTPTAPTSQPQEVPRSPTNPTDSPASEVAPTGSAEEVAIPFQEMAALGVGGLPAWPGTLEQLNQLVQEARNKRLYPNPNPGESLRRAPWYFSGGCYAKAAHVSALAEKIGFPQAGKVFVFGDWATLRFKSQYMPDGAAWWSYHVVAAYHIESQVYVLDPLVEPEHALTVNDWVRAIAPRPEKISIAFCDRNVYSPSDQCIGGDSNGAYTGHINGMLQEEYQSLQSLGFDPNTLL